MAIPSRASTFSTPLSKALLRALQRPEFNIRGIRRADLAPFLRPISPASLSRYLWRRRQFGLIKKVVHGYRDDLARLGRSTIALVESRNQASSRLSPTLPRDRICSENVRICVLRRYPQFFIPLCAILLVDSEIGGIADGGRHGS